MFNPFKYLYHISKYLYYNGKYHGAIKNGYSDYYISIYNWNRQYHEWQARESLKIKVGSH